MSSLPEDDLVEYKQLILLFKNSLCKNPYLEKFFDLYSNTTFSTFKTSFDLPELKEILDQVFYAIIAKSMNKIAQANLNFSSTNQPITYRDFFIASLV